MTFQRRRAIVVLAFLPLVTCGRDALDPGAGAIETIVVSPAVSTVSIGASVGLSAQVLTTQGEPLEDRQVHWTSEDPEIATVSSNGMVTAHAVGVVQVAASTGGRSGLAQVTVTIVPVASVHVTPGNKSLFVEETFQLEAEPRDGAGNALQGRPVTWSSNNESIVSVNATGMITALAPGGAIITASSEGKSAVASITVTSIPVASVEVTPASPTLVEGQTAQLQATPFDADHQPLTGRLVLWTTSNPSVATVTSTGLITTHARGTATIRATCEGKVGTASLTVDARPPNAVVVTPAQSVVEIGKTSQLSAQVLDDLGRVIGDSPVTWSSSNNAVAAVSQSGVVTAVAVGTATISASSAGKTGTAQITVTPVPVGTVVVSPPSPVIIVGRTTQLSAQAYSADGQQLSGRAITWSSSTPSIAQVNTSGVVTAVSTGSTIVFASIDGVLGWANVTVVPVPVANVTVSPSTAMVISGQTTVFTATVKDAAGNTLQGRLITWSTNQPSVATVNGSGVVAGLSPGTATVTATSEGKTGTATVTVVAATNTVKVTPDTATLRIFGSVKLTAVVRDPFGVVIPGAPIEWSSSNSGLAWVGSDGTVTAGFGNGTAIITAKSGTVSGTSRITVRPGG